MTNPSFKSPAIVLATWFGVGYLPKAPGTWGSFAALPCAWFLCDWFGSLALICAIVVLFFIGILVSDIYVRSVGEDDPGSVVVDEVVGQWLTLVCVPPNLIYYFFGFVIFRIFDIWKPWPANLVDQKLKSGFGIMLDDIIAAVYSGTLLLGIYHLDRI